MQLKILLKIAICQGDFLPAPKNPRRPQICLGEPKDRRMFQEKVKGLPGYPPKDNIEAKSRVFKKKTARLEGWPDIK
eukprot:2069205-Rhodomonas_salina.2